MDLAADLEEEAPDADLEEAEVILDEEEMEEEVEVIPEEPSFNRFLELWFWIL